MPVYSIKNDETLAIRAFSNSKAAYDFGYRQQVFSTHDELYNTNLTDDQLRDVHYLVTGFETRVQYRDYLCELIFNAIKTAGLPLTDVDGDCSISVESESESEPEPESEPIDSKPVHVSSEPVHIPNDPTEDMADDLIPLNHEPPAINPYPTIMEPDLSFIEPEPVEPEPIADEPPTMDPDPAAILDLIVNKELKDKEEEIQKQFKNLVIYGTSHPDAYKSAPKISKKSLALSTSPKTKYSRREKIIFKTIVEAYPEPITTKDIIEKAFQSYKKFHVKNAVAVATKSLANKVAYNEEPFLLKISGNSGPKPMSVWIEGKGEEK